MPLINTDDRKSRVASIMAEFLSAVRPDLPDDETYKHLEENLNKLSSIDDALQQRITMLSGDKTAFNLCARMDHDMTYVWVGLRKYGHPMLMATAKDTLQEALDHIAPQESHFDSDCRPSEPLQKVITIMAALPVPANTI